MRIIKTTVFVLLWGLPVASYAQAPDLSALPPLPALGEQAGGAAALPTFGSTAPTTVNTTPAAAVPGTSAVKAAGRADASVLDDLIPAAPVSIPPAQESNAAAIENIPTTLPELPVTPPSQIATPEIKAPKSLEEEAAAAGLVPPTPSLPEVPAATAQALLSGQPLGSYDDEEEAAQLPAVKVKKKPSWRDLPKLKPSVAPLSLTYNYQRQVLPPSIYKKEYDAENRHLPRATMREDWDRHFFGAVAANNVNATRAFLDMGKSPDMVSPRGDTALVTAVRYGALDTARLLLARGANPQLAGGNGIAPLALASASGQRAMQQVLEARLSYASYQPAQ